MAKPTTSPTPQPAPWRPGLSPSSKPLPHLPDPSCLRTFPEWLACALVPRLGPASAPWGLLSLSHQSLARPDHQLLASGSSWAMKTEHSHHPRRSYWTAMEAKQSSSGGSQWVAVLRRKAAVAPTVQHRGSQLLSPCRESCLRLALFTLTQWSPLIIH